MASIERSSPTIAMSAFKTKPYRHQLHYLNNHSREKYFALLAEQGTGKTWMIINNVAQLWASGDCDALLVFAPNGVHYNWTIEEIPKHMPGWIRYKSAAWCSTAKKEDKKKLDALYHDPFDKSLRILTMNWEALQTKRGFSFAEEFCLGASKLMIACDESDSIKNPKAARTKALMKLKKYSEWRRIMTGTMINNSPFDAFSQYSFLDDSILETTSYYAFKSEYAEMIQDGSPLMSSIRAKTGSRFTPQIVERDENGLPKYKNLDKLSLLIAPHSYRVLKKDCLDLPDKIHTTLYFDLTKEQEVIYKKAKDEGRLIFENEDTPFNRLAVFSKLAQITSGYYIHPCSDDAIRIDGKNPKLLLLEEKVLKAIEDREKVIIWARYRIEIEDIRKILVGHGIKCVQYHGGIKKDDRIKAIEDFEKGDAQVFIGNQQAGATGITLVAASHVIYFSNSFSLRDRLQSEDRAHRIGQTKTVTYTNLAARGTIDEHVINTLLSKKDVADEILNANVDLLHKKLYF